MDDDAELLRRCPDPDAVEAFYRRHVDAVLRFAVRRCATPDDVADLVSITFLEAIRSAHGYDARRGPARPWLLGIAARCLADHLRDRYRRADALARLRERPALDADESETVERMIDAARLAAPLARAMERLTEAEREVLVLVAEDGLPVADAARVLGIPPVAGRMRLSRARRKLRPLLAPLTNGGEG